MDSSKPNELIEVAMEADLRQLADAIFQRLGLSHAQAIALFFEELVRRGVLPFPCVGSAATGDRPDDP